MPINNEIQYEAALNRFRYLDSLQFYTLSSSEESEWLKLISDIYDYEEIHYPIEDTDATRSNT